MDKLKKFEAKLNRQQPQQQQQQQSYDVPGGLGGGESFGSSAPFAGFDEMNAYMGGLGAQHSEFDENIRNVAQEVDGVNYDEYMQRVHGAHQAAAVAAPKRAPPARPGARHEDVNQHGHTIQNRNYSDDRNSDYHSEPLRQSQQSYKPQPFSPPTGRQFAPNPLLSAQNTGSPSGGGGKIMGLLERKLANRSGNSLASAPSPLHRAAPLPPASQQWGQQQGYYQPGPSHQDNGYPAQFRDDYSETTGSESFGWQGLAH